MRRRLGLTLMLALLALAACVMVAAPAARASAPATAFAPYVDLTAWPTPNLVQLRRASGIRDATLAFVTAISFTLPVLPSGLTPHPAGRMATYTIDAATHTLAQLHRLMPTLSLSARERMLGVTPMIGRNDTLGMWALQRDRPCPRPQHGAVDSCSGISQAPDAFSHAFGA